MGGQSTDVKVWDENDSTDLETMSPRLCPVCGSLGTGRFMHEHIDAEHTPRLPEQPIESRPPNRWAAFSDEELRVLRDGLAAGRGEGLLAETEFEALDSEIAADQERRRS